MRRRLPLGSPEVLALVALLEEGEMNATDLREASRVTWRRWAKLHPWLVEQGLVRITREQRVGRSTHRRYALTRHGQVAARHFRKGLDQVFEAPEAAPPPRARAKPRRGA